MPHVHIVHPRIALSTGVWLVLLLLPLPSLASHTKIQTPNDSIPDFCDQPTIRSIQSGNWTNPATWDQGRVPNENDAVLVTANTTVTFNAPDGATRCIGAHGTLTFSTTLSTRLTVTHLLVYQDGTLRIGTEQQPIPPTLLAEIVFRSTPIDTTSDPQQFGNGLLAWGTVTMHGAFRTAGVDSRLAVEPLAGQTTLTYAQAPVGFRAGDELFIPDSRILQNASYTPQWEVVRIQSVTGPTVALSAPLQYDHPGARDANGALAFLPHAVNLTRNIILRSENPDDVPTRGHTLFTHRATVDIRYAAFTDLGRTTVAPLDNTTFDASGNVVHVGTNHIGRYALHTHHLMGPTQTPANGYQYTLVGNVVDRSSKWAFTNHNSHYGLIDGNTASRGQGAGFVFEDGGESFNLRSRNFAGEFSGFGDRMSDGAGFGFYARGPNNHDRFNVAANIYNFPSIPLLALPGDTVHNKGTGGPETSYGLKYFLRHLGNIRVPKAPGADTSNDADVTIQDANAMPLLEFDGNEVYGSQNGMVYWWINAKAGDTNEHGAETVFRNYVTWHLFVKGAFHYPSAHITFDNWRSVDAKRGFVGGDYDAHDVKIINSRFTGGLTCVGLSTRGGGYTQGPAGPQTVENTVLENCQEGVEAVGMFTNNPPSADLGLPPQLLHVKNVTFSGNAVDIHKGDSGQHPTQRSQLFVENAVSDHWGNVPRSFQVFGVKQDPAAILPQVGVTNANMLLNGAPRADTTNQENWNLYRLARGGELASCSSTTPGVVSGGGAPAFTCPFTPANIAFDLQRPHITAVAQAKVAPTTARVTVTTDEPAHVVVLLGSADDRIADVGAFPGPVGTLATTHTIDLPSLDPVTTYYYRVTVVDANGNRGPASPTSSSRSFALSSLGNDVTPPVISAVSASALTSASERITWTTDESADSQVEYGLTTSYGQSSTLNASLVTSHTVNLTGLTPSTLYHYRVRSADASGNTAFSPDQTFTTTGGGTPTPTPTPTPTATPTPSPDTDGPLITLMQNGSLVSTIACIAGQQCTATITAADQSGIADGSFVCTNLPTGSSC